ncbi:hypothetical protein CDL12_14708 [Handroanthus impetiginosus]|uniref:TRF2/HOY1 PH-like domain-containing protein n=1 Tax=Handroanthus impetiginosus TaxID=429701 RepID=A0A2G9H580_9LAMI|nr:hypothetical protein CDL12_14708 [Handroanthus impetiginosus]
MNDDQKNENIILGEEEEGDEEGVEAFVSSVLNTFEYENSSDNGSENSSINNDERVTVDRSPLGLKLSKTKSFMNLLSSKFQSLPDQKFEKDDSIQDTDTFTDKKFEGSDPIQDTDTSTDQKFEGSDSIQDTDTSTDKNFERSDSIQNTDPSPTYKYQKLKASNFPIKCVKIGAWQRISRYDGELVAKFYYAKQKIIWEFIDGPLKSKIEILWSDISAIKAILHDNQPGVLALELSNRPTFFKEVDPQPRKHSVWKPWIDFTGNHASISRRHCGYFAPKVLDRHYEKLLECDPRLFELNQQPFPSSQSPFFNSLRVRAPRNIPHNSNNLGQGVSPVMQHPNLNPTRRAARAFLPMVQYSNSNPTRIAIGEVSPILQCPNSNPTRIGIGEVLPMVQCPNSNPTRIASGEFPPMVQYSNPNPSPNPSRIGSGEVSPMVQYPNSNPTSIANGKVVPMVQYRSPNPTRIAGRQVLPMLQCPNTNPTRIATRGVSAMVQYPNSNPIKRTLGEVSVTMQGPNPNRTKVATGEVSSMVQHPNSNLTRIATIGVSPMMQYRNPNPNRNQNTRYPNNPTAGALVRVTPNQSFIRPPLIDTNGRPINYQVVNRRPPEMVNFPGQNSNYKQDQSMRASQNCNSNDQIELSDIENFIMQDYQEYNP